jgi:TIR domain
LCYHGHDCNDGVAPRGRQVWVKSMSGRTLSVASFCVTLVGFTPAESTDLGDALRRAGGPLTFEIKREPSAAAASFPESVIHAIVFTPIGLSQATPADVDAIRSATKSGTCRAYLSVAPGSVLTPSVGLLDDFIQWTPTHDFVAIAEKVIAFFREADDLNRRSTPLAVRDMTCLGAYSFLKFLWPVSYLFAALHIFNAAMVLAGRGPWLGVLASQYVVPASTFFGAFFIVHCIFVVFRNWLFWARIAKMLKPGFVLGEVAFGLAAAATAYSIAAVDQNVLRIFVSAIFAVGAYLFYLYARRIRVECTSLSQLQTDMADSQRRIDILNSIGRHPIVSSAFPLLPSRSRSLFISYMHGSQWSSETAALVHQWASEHGLEVFLDRSSIPSGTLWRQSLLRAISECGFFVAVIDGDATATEWVLAESAYAALLRKSIGKPRILLVIRNVERIAKDQQNPFHAIFLDVFQLPSTCYYGVAILPIDKEHLAKERFLQALEGVRPMCLFS